jgi:hypothetical protein
MHVDICIIVDVLSRRAGYCGHKVHNRDMEYWYHIVGWLVSACCTVAIGESGYVIVLIQIKILCLDPSANITVIFEVSIRQNASYEWDVYTTRISSCAIPHYRNH